MVGGGGVGVGGGREGELEFFGNWKGGNEIKQHEV